MIRKHSTTQRFFIHGTACMVLLLMITACAEPGLVLDPIISATAKTQHTATHIPSTPATLTVTSSPTQTRTPGPSPTSTPLLPLQAHTWDAEPIMIEAAYSGMDLTEAFKYTPFFVVYGDGLLVKRSCTNDACQYLQATLEQDALCRLINAIDRTGFLHADPMAFQVPGGTGNQVHFSISVDTNNSVTIPDLDRWVESPDWFTEYAGCINCFKPPEIDPAYLNIYRLLTTYDVLSMSGLTTERLAVWLSKPIIVGSPQIWDQDLVTLSQLADLSLCPADPTRRQAITLAGQQAHAVANFLSIQGNRPPVFREGDLMWQVNSRWLLPFEMPQTCQQAAGFYPPTDNLGISWRCEPEMGSIPTPTATITPTPTMTRTPLR